MICYTRNFEDVILQRVFSEVVQGSYLDVGASSPVLDSNTYALYEKGWRGVAIEPIPDYKDSWEKYRPHDILINSAVGSSKKNLTLHIYDQAPQCSSASKDVQIHLESAGLQKTRTLTVSVLSLDDLVNKYFLQKVLHLLSIDVEGMEKEVLQSLDLRVNRPWVVILEATLPGTSKPTHHAWEPYLLNNGYLLTYFDGVNRFYLAQEHRRLLVHFALPPNVWDGFRSIKELNLESQVQQLKAQVQSLQTQILN